MSAIVRRARPLLGTLIEVGARDEGDGAGAALAIDAAFLLIGQIQARLSRFEPGSDIGRFNALAAGGRTAVHADTQIVLRAALRLQAATLGQFDISLGSGADDWSLQGDHLVKRARGIKLDLGGIGKGYAVDAATELLQARGCTAGWVNAGGDLRTFGAAPLTLHLRDEAHGRARAWGRLQDGACATSHYAPGSRSTLADGHGLTRHVSVMAALCLWADALTKIAAGDCQHPALREFDATAWWH